MSWHGWKNPWIIVAAGLLALAVADETWFMPGPVSRSHAGIETQCRLCHPGFSGTPNSGCLSCKSKMHLKEDRGIHRYAENKRCADCHVEHRTRLYPLASAWLVPERFDHRWSGYELGRFHRDLACEKCHPPGRPYRKVDLTCDGCHDDFASGVWDHKKTGCPLDSLHAGLSCIRCHKENWGPGRVPNCCDCHHRDRYRPEDLCVSKADK